MSSRHSSLIQGIVLKRSPIKEKDLLITLLSKEQGKITARASGARKLHSSLSSCLEPGTHATFWCVGSAEFPIITQAKMLNSCWSTNASLQSLQKMTYFLEIIDTLFSSEELEDHIWQLVLELHQQVLIDTQKTTLRRLLQQLVAHLGFELPDASTDSLNEVFIHLKGTPPTAYQLLQVR